MAHSKQITKQKSHGYTTKPSKMRLVTWGFGTIGLLTTLVSSIGLVSQLANTNYSVSVHDQLQAPTAVFKEGSGETTNNGMDNMQPNMNAADFDSFAQTLKEKEAAEIDKAIDQISNLLKTESMNLVNNKPMPTVNEIANSIYLNKVADYLLANKAQIKENPSQHGWVTNFLSILANDKTYEVGTVKFNGQDFNQVILGLANSRDYANVINTMRGDSVVKNNDSNTVNTISKADLEKQISSYFEALLEKALEIFANSDDLPKNPTFTNNGMLDLAEPMVGDSQVSWDEYIKQAISNRFTSFDLNQNQQFLNEDATDIPITPLPSNPSFEDPTMDTNPQVDQENVTTQRENVPRLFPILKHQFLPNSPEALAQTLRNLSGEMAASRFFYDNPIYPRVIYRTTMVTNFIPTVMITDNVTNQTITYSNREVSFERGEDQNYLKAKEVATYALQDLMNRFYGALGVNPMMFNLATISSNILVNAVNEMIFFANRLYHNPNFQTALNNFIFNLRNNASGIDNNTNITYEVAQQFFNTSWVQQIQSFWLETLKASQLNRMSYWLNLSSSYGIVFNRFFGFINRQTENVDNLAKIQMNLQRMDLDYDHFKKAVQTLFGMTNDLQSLLTRPTTNVLNQFNTMVDQITALQTQFKNLALLTQQTVGADDEAKIKEAYANLFVSNTNQTTQSNQYYALLIGFGVVSVAFLVAATSLYFYMRHKQRIKMPVSAQ